MMRRSYPLIPTLTLSGLLEFRLPRWSTHRHLVLAMPVLSPRMGQVLRAEGRSLNPVAVGALPVRTLGILWLHKNLCAVDILNFQSWLWLPGKSKTT